VTIQPEALSLADYLDLPHVGQHRSAAELRRLHALNGELLEALKNYVDGCSVGVNATEVARAAIARATEEGT
jgi:hypothetical protein